MNILLTKINDLDLSETSRAAIKADNIVYVGDMVQRTPDEWLQSPHVGAAEVLDMQIAAEKLGTSLGAKVSWPPAILS